MLSAIGTLIGGLGLFLLAVRLITEGLKQAAGDSLRDFLARSTATRLRGVLFGMAVTGLLQSSSAVTVATIGFVNAGLLTLAEAISIVFGANIGTTLTGWLVSIVGFNLRLELFALPLLGIGMFAMTVWGTRSRWGALGEALAGFGLFFIGIDFLREAFVGLSDLLALESIQAGGVGGTLLFVGFGFLMTLVTQSSSAAIALTLTAASGGMLSIAAGAAVVIGSSLGTTSTAAFAAIGATANARRVAAAHVVFNVLTAVVALLLLPVLLAIVRLTGDLLNLGDIPSVTLAMFHTTFKILGVLLVWPFADRLADLLSQRFRTQAETLGRPQFLDRNIVATPTLAIEALRQELQRSLHMAHDYAAMVLRRDRVPVGKSATQQEALDSLLEASQAFVSRLEFERLPPGSAQQLALVLRVLDYQQDIVELAQEIAERDRHIETVVKESPGTEVNAYVAHVIENLEALMALEEGSDMEAPRQRLQALETEWRRLKTTLLQAAAGKKVSLHKLNVSIEPLRQMNRLCDRFLKAVERLRELDSSLTPESPEAEPAGDGEPPQAAS
ncbi:MAG: Na/Pi symporter [Pseudohongiellaceae bacterium]